MNTLLALSLAAAAASPSYELDHRTLRWQSADGARQEQALPCEGRSLLQHADKLYIACGPDGVLVLAAAESGPRLIERRDAGGSAEGFFLLDGAVWARITRQEARPLEATQAIHAERTATPAPSAATIARAAKAGGLVLQRAGQLVVELGSDAGLRPQDRVEFYVENAVDLGDGRTATREEVLAIGEVTAVASNRSEVALGLNEVVPPDAKARATQQPVSANRWNPPRVAGVWETEFMVRPFLALGDMGIGSVGEASLGYRFPQSMHLEARLAPLGFGIAEGGDVIVAAANLILGYDTRSFEIGFGLGWSAINDAIELGGSDSDDGGAGGVEFERVRDGLSIAQVARLGALDGLNLSAQNSFLYYDEEFNYGGTAAEIQVPVGDRSWILLRGGGGIAGYAFGEAGLRILLRGNGGPGSLFITPSLGGAGVWGETVETDVVEGRSYEFVKDVSYGGPSVGFGMEWRN